MGKVLVWLIKLKRIAYFDFPVFEKFTAVNW